LPESDEDFMNLNFLDLGYESPFRVLKGEILEIQQSSLPWILLICGILLAIGAIVDFVVRVVPQRNMEKDSIRIEKNKQIAQIYNTLYRNIESKASYENIIYQIDHISRLVLSLNEHFQWLEEIDISKIPVKIKDEVTALFNNISKMSKGILQESDVNNSLQYLTISTILLPRGCKYLEKLAMFWESVEFSTPEYFIIAGIGVLLLIFIPLSRRKRGLAIDLDYWQTHISSKGKRVLIMSVPVILISLLLAGALATPQSISRDSKLIVGKPVLMVVDYSGSTSAATEFHPEETMQEAAQRVFVNLTDLRADINFALMIYAKENYLARYFTYKNELFADTLDNWDVLMRVSQQTRTADALAAANKFMSENTSMGVDKAIILVSDLDYNANDLPEMERNIDEILAVGSNYI
jgi:hypothetical protein